MPFSGNISGKKTLREQKIFLEKRPYGTRNIGLPQPLNGGRAPQSVRLPESVTLDDGLSEQLPSRSEEEVRRP